jgi:hypothetical protein
MLLLLLVVVTMYCSFVVDVFLFIFVVVCIVLNCVVLRETISFLRTYATNGYLDGQLTGMEILQSTVDALQKEANTVQSSIVNSTEIMMRRKIMELNLWLLTAFVLDFITLPPAQPSGRESMSSRMSAMYPIKAANILYGMPDFSHFMISPQSPASASASGASGASGGRTDSASPPPPGAARRASTASFSEIAVEASRLRNKSLDATSAADLLLSSPTPTAGQSPSQSQSQSGKQRRSSLSNAADAGAGSGGSSVTSRGDGLGLSSDFGGSSSTKGGGAESTSLKLFSPQARVEQSRRDRLLAISAQSSTNAQNAKKWKLVETLLNLLGPIGSATWQTIDRVERFKAAMKVGYRLGRFAMHLMQESVDSILVQPTSTPLTPLKNSTMPAAKGNKDALLLRAIDGTYWIILRVLLDLFVQSPFDDGEVKVNGPQPVALRALSRLMTQLEYVKDVSREYYDSESLFIVIKLADVLHSEKVQPIYSTWSKEAITTITMLLSQQRDKIRERIGVLSTVLERPSSFHSSPGSDVDANFNGGGTGAGGGDSGGGGGRSRTNTAASSSVDPEGTTSCVWSDLRLEHEEESPRNSIGSQSDALSPTSTTGPLAPISAKKQHGMSSKSLLAASFMRKTTTGSFDEVSGGKNELLQGNPTEVVLSAINQSLKLKDGDALSWAAWSELTEPIMREALRAERDMLATKLNVLGLHKDSQESAKQLEDARRTEDNQLAALGQKMEDLDLRVRAMESKRTRELLRLEEGRKKRVKASWAEVYEDLANERGPWGGGQGGDTPDVSVVVFSNASLVLLPSLSLFLLLFFSVSFI